MSFLTDGDLRQAIKEGRLKVEPFDPETIQPGSVEFSLGNDFRVFRYTSHSEVDTKKSADLEKFTEVLKVKDGDYFLLLPRELVLATTKEKIGLAADLVGFIEGKSSYARLGVAIHVTAGFIHPGSYGVQTLEISNLTNFPIKIYPGSKICQIIVAETKSPAEVPYGKKKGAKYFNQKGPESAKI